MPSYPGTPAESSFQSSSLGSVRGSNQARLATEGSRDRLLAPRARNQSGAESVIRSVQVTGTCKAVQVSRTILGLLMCLTEIGCSVRRSLALGR